MKEDYLWDKTGNDTEIERLEIALQAFRHTETAPPAIAAKVLPFKEKPARRIFPFAIAAAACVAFVAISLGVWFQILNNKIEDKTDLTKAAQPQNDLVVSTTKAESDTEDFVEIKTSVKPNQPDVRQVKKINKIAFAENPPKKSRAQNIKAQKPSVVLTKEEQFAYDQLMLALSITSSKLKLVKDKVEGAEEKVIVRQEGR